jgi:DivIVA domain-containing protein
MRAQDVAAQRFTPTVFKDGYAQQDVDDLLDRIEVTFTVAEQGSVPVDGRLATAKPVGPEDVQRARFRPTRWKQGYDQDEVDRFLERVVVALRELRGA